MGTLRNISLNNVIKQWEIHRVYGNCCSVDGYIATPTGKKMFYYNGHLLISSP